MQSVSEEDESEQSGSRQMMRSVAASADSSSDLAPSIVSRGLNSINSSSLAPSMKSESLVSITISRESQDQKSLDFDQNRDDPRPSGFANDGRVNLSLGCPRNNDKAVLPLMNKAPAWLKMAAFE